MRPWIRWLLIIAIWAGLCGWLAYVVWAGESPTDDSLDLEHVGHELWHQIVPVLGGATGLAIAGFLFHRKKKGQ